MNAPKVFGVQSTRQIEPESFLLTDQNGIVVGEPFRVMPKIRLDIVQMMVAAVQLDGKGDRIYNIDILNHVISESLVREVYNPVAEKWEPVNDRERFAEVIASDRWNIPIETLGEIVMWLTEIATGGHPTGGPKPSSGGPTTSPATSTVPVDSGGFPSTPSTIPSTGSPSPTRW
jgi:hypothetical protein